MTNERIAALEAEVRALKRAARPKYGRICEACKPPRYFETYDNDQDRCIWCTENDRYVDDDDDDRSWGAHST